MPKWVKKFGKWAIIVYIAYNVIELTIVLLFFPELLNLTGVLS
jgi:hypothetical protein